MNPKISLVNRLVPGGAVWLAVLLACCVVPGAAAAPVGLLDREHGPVCSIIGGAVPFDLAIDRTGMPFQLPCDLCGTMPARAHRCDSVSFVSA